MQIHIITINTVLLYLDPGTGSLLIQSIIAAVMGGLYFFGNIKRKIICIFYLIMKKHDKTGD